jgi:hypothetical protein
VSASSTSIWIVASLLIVALLIAALPYVLRRRRMQRRQAQAAPNPPVERAASRSVDFESIAACHPTSWRLEDQPGDWQSAMAGIGARMARARVARVLFVHGTMTGHDPLAMGSVVKRALPLLPQRVEGVIQRVAKAGSDRILGDLGNYSPEYVRLFEAALGNEIACSSFVWSSANHHVARVRAAAWLALRLAPVEMATGSKGQPPRVLLVGHSHAGQIFALLTQLLAGGSSAELLLEAARASGEKEDELRVALGRIRELELDFVTLGTAPRYAWGDVQGYRVVHFVNHRSEEVARRPLRALLNSAQSDYVRRLGAAGSDFPAWTIRERRINLHLDAALGRGSDLKTWFSGVRSGDAFMPTGTTLLIRYRQVSTGMAPKFVDAYFGHGVYTRKGAMLFTAKLVADHFYPDGPNARDVALEKASLVHRVRVRVRTLGRSVLWTGIRFVGLVRLRFPILSRSLRERFFIQRRHRGTLDSASRE